MVTVQKQELIKMVRCLKCGRERKEKGLNILKPCPYCGTTLQEEISIADG